MMNTNLKTDPKLLALIEKSKADFNALPVAEQESMMQRQKESYVRGEMAMGSDIQEAADRLAIRTTPTAS